MACLLQKRARMTYTKHRLAKLGMVLMVAGLAFSAGTAGANELPLHLRNGRRVRIQLGAHHDIGNQLAWRDGWRLELGDVRATKAHLVDVTPHASLGDWEVPIVNGTLRLDPERFLPDHAYRVTIYSGTETRSTLVYLAPPPRRSVTRLDMSGHEDADEGIAPVPKGRI
jgi:hypothetical protein